MTILYDPTDPFYRTLFRWKGSVFSLVICRPLFWVMLLIHLALLIVDRNLYWDVGGDAQVGSGTSTTCAYDGCGFVAPLSWEAVGTMTALLTFFLVFCTNQSHDRLRLLHSHCVGLGGLTQNWATLVRNEIDHIPHRHAFQWQLCRLLLASMHLLFFMIDDSEGGRGLANNERRILEKRELLKSFELEAIERFKGFRPNLPVVWALRELHHALEARAEVMGFPDHQLAMQFREIAFAFRGHMGQIENWLTQPLPFSYFYLLTLTLVCTLLFLSWGMVTLQFNAMLTVSVYITLLLLFVGLKEVAMLMANPFGEGDVHFDVKNMLTAAYNNAKGILEDEWEPQIRTSQSLAAAPSGVRSEQRGGSRGHAQSGAGVPSPDGPEDVAPWSEASCSAPGKLRTKASLHKRAATEPRSMQQQRSSAAGGTTEAWNQYEQEVSRWMEEASQWHQQYGSASSPMAMPGGDQGDDRLAEALAEAELYRTGWQTVCSLVGTADEAEVNGALAALPARLRSEARQILPPDQPSLGSAPSTGMGKLDA